MSFPAYAAAVPGLVLWVVTALGLVLAAIGVVGVLLDMRRRSRGRAPHPDDGFVAKMLQFQFTVSESVGLVLMGGVFAVGVWAINDLLDDDIDGEVLSTQISSTPDTTTPDTTTTVTAAPTPAVTATSTPATTLAPGLPVVFPQRAYDPADDGGWYNAPAETVTADLRNLGLKVRVFDQGCSSSVDAGNVRMVTYGGDWNTGIVFGKSSDAIDSTALADLVSGDEVQVWLSTQRPC